MGSIKIHEKIIQDLEIQIEAMSQKRTKMAKHLDEYELWDDDNFRIYHEISDDLASLQDTLDEL